MNESIFTFRVDEALKNNFVNAAKLRDRTGAQLMRDFMRAYVKQQQEAVEYDAWFRREVQIGQESARTNNGMPADEVEAKFAAMKAATLRELESR